MEALCCATSNSPSLRALDDKRKSVSVALSHLRAGWRRVHEARENVAGSEKEEKS